MGGTSRANNQWSRKCHQANAVCFDHLKTVHPGTFFTNILHLLLVFHCETRCTPGWPAPRLSFWVVFFLLKWCLISLMAFCDIVYPSLHCENVTTNGRFVVFQSSGCFRGTTTSVNRWKSSLPALISCTAMMPLCFCLLMLLLPTNVHIPQWKNKPDPMACHSNIELSWTEPNHLSVFAYRLSRSQDAWGGMPDHCLSLPVWWWDSSPPPSLCPTEVRIMDFSRDKQGPAFSRASACARVNSHPVCSRIHRTVILQQPVVISPVYRNHVF